MSIALLVVIGIALLAGGVGVTFALASAVPQDVLQRAGQWSVRRRADGG